MKHFLHFYRSKRCEIISVTAILHIVSHRQSHEGDDGLIWLGSDVGERKRIAGRWKKQPADTERRVTLGHVNKLLKLQVKDVLVSSAGILFHSFNILFDRITLTQLPLYGENVYNFQVTAQDSNTSASETHFNESWQSAALAAWEEDSAVFIEH